MEGTYLRTKREIEYLLSHQELLSASEKQELTDSLRAVELELALLDRNRERERLLGDYYYFFQQAWPWVENVQLVTNWHIKMICRYLHALQERKPFRDLIINVPPGCSKSINTMVIWPAWVFARNPCERLMCASYDGDLVKKQAVDSKRLMTSDWYQSFFGDKVQIRPDVDTQIYFETTAGGSRFSTTPRGKATGRHPTLIACDDLANPKQADSDAERNSLIDWWDGTMETRGAASEMNRCRVVIGQRLHKKDIPGHIMETDEGNEWARLILPMRFESGRMTDVGLGNDPRTVEGELLDPVRFPEEQLKKTERRLGIYGTAGQLQQRPTAKDGAVFKIESINIVPLDAVPMRKITRIKRFWDKASLKDAGDYTAGALGGVVPGEFPKFFVFDMVHAQLSSDEVERQIELWAKIDQKRFGREKYEVLFEREGGASGIQASQETIRHLRGYRVRALKPTTNKIVRAEPLANAIAAGEVYFVEGPWVHGCIEEMRYFPKVDHDDRVDALSGVYMGLISGSFGDFDSEDQEEGERLVRCRNVNCNRMGMEDTGYCCDSCIQAEHRGVNLSDHDHCPACAYRHGQLYATGDWDPAYA